MAPESLQLRPGMAIPVATSRDLCTHKFVTREVEYETVVIDRIERIERRSVLPFRVAQWRDVFAVLVRGTALARTSRQLQVAHDEVDAA